MMSLLFDLLAGLRNLAGVRGLLGHVGTHPLRYGVVAVLAVLLAAGYVTVYFNYIQPARTTVATFFEAIDDEEYEIAWELLDEDLRKRWQGGLDHFRQGYATTVKHTDVSLSDAFSLRQLQGAMFGKCLELDVRYRVIDRFDKKTLSDPMQFSNCLSLALRHPALYRQLAQGTLPNTESTVELTRIYEKRATLSKKHGEWRISSLQSRFLTFEYQMR